MGRYTKTFEDAVNYAKDLLDKKETVENAAKRAADLYKEDVDKIMCKILTGRVPLPNEEAEKKARTMAKRKKSRKNKTSVNPRSQQVSHAAAEAKEENLFVYDGLVDIVCFNHDIKEVHIKEAVLAMDKQSAKEKIYEKIQQQFLPIRIPAENWNTCLKKETGVV